LSIAAAEGNAAIVRLLLQRGADPNIATRENRRPLLTAAYHGHTEIARLLIDAGADIDTADSSFGFTALMEAAGRGHAGVVKLLLERGADRNIRSMDGRTAADFAFGFGRQDVLELLQGFPAPVE
jgi:uncharacterized protein